VINKARCVDHQIFIENNNVKKPSNSKSIQTWKKAN